MIQFFLSIVDILRGKKTYIVAGLLALVALENLISGDSTVSQFLSDPNLMILLGSGGLASLRAGIAKLV